MISPRALRGCFFALGLVALPLTAGEPRRLIVISWDGAADWVVDRLLAEGRLPNLAALAARGMAAEHSVTTFPSKTAAGHAALWTGCGPGVNGISGNEVPRLPAAEHTVLESLRGFSSEALAAEPLYISAAKAGKRVVVLSATQSFPAEPHLRALEAAGVPAAAYRSVSGFEHEIAAGEMISAEAFGPPGRGWGRRGGREARTLVGESELFALAYDDPADPVRGLDTVLVRQGSRDRRRATAEAELKPRAADGVPGGWSPVFRVRKGGLVGGTYFRLFELAADGSRLALYRRTASALRGAISAPDLTAYEGAYPGFHDDPFGLYEQGGFDTPLPAGGDGTAEQRVLELVAFDLDLAAAGTSWALAHWQPDVLFHYTPMSDSAGHTWMALLDPAAPGHDPAAAARLWPFYARVFELQDAWLGKIVAAAEPGTIVALVSDHGMAGVRRDVHINRLLADAGLLAWTADGAVDLAKTRIVAAFADFQLRVNGTDRKGGIVAPAERVAVLAAAERALREARDPQTGRPVVATVFRPAERPDLLLTGPRAGDLAYDLVPGYYPQQGASAEAVTPSKVPWGAGQHGFLPERREMHAIFYAAGGSIPPGLELPPIRHVDVAPTLARLLGIAPPSGACGQDLLAPSAADGYVDDARCATCHTELARSYRAVGMARSFFRPNPGSVVEAEAARTFFHAPSRRWYELVIDAGGYRFRQWQIGADGRRVNQLELPVEAVLGSGNHARTYLYRTPSNELFQLPVAWYAESGRLGMAPGYDRPDHVGVSRAVRRECLFCHNAYPDVAAGSDHHGEVHGFPAELPQGTGCQRCHGPGAAHLALAEGGLGGPEQIRAAIVQPAKLAPPLRDDVCRQCHWQPSVAIPGVRRLDRGDYSYRPGELLGDYLVRVDVDEEGLGREDRFEINHHPYRLEQSRCFVASAGQLSCLSCHDPHRKVSPDERVEHFRAACRQCHEPDSCTVKPEPADCVSCHMPKRRPRDVVQVVMTDHRIQKPPADLAVLVAPRAESEPVLVGVRVLPGAGAPAGAEAELYRALAAVRAAPSATTVDRLHQFLVAAPAGEIGPALDLATARLGRRDFATAERELRALLVENPGNALALEWLGVALHGLNRQEEAAQALEQALAGGSRRIETPFNLAVVRLGLGQPDVAAALLEQVVALRPNFAPAWAQLGRARLALDQPRPAAGALRQALALDGTDARLYPALAQALRRAGQPEEAERVLADGRLLALGRLN